MSLFSDKLRYAINKSGYTIYGLSKKTGINRTVIQKVLSDERVLKNEHLKKIVSNLMMTESEKSDLFNCYYIKILGNEKYENFITIKKALESFQDASSIKNVTFTSAFDENIFESGESSVMKGFYCVQNTICSLINIETKKSTPLIYFNLDTSIDSSITQLITYSYYIHRDNIDLKNIIHFSSYSSKANQNFLEFLKYLPLAFYNYFPHYYFDDSNTKNNIPLLFPYYIITSSAVLEISSNCKEAILHTGKNIVECFKNKFIEEYNQSYAFQYECIEEMDIINLLSSRTLAGEQIHTIEDVLCAVPALNRELAYQYAKTELSQLGNINDLIEIFIDYASKLKDNSFIISSNDVIDDFAKTGVLKEFPPEFVNTLSVDARITVLENTRKLLENKNYYFYQYGLFKWPKNFQLVVISSDEILISKMGNPSKYSSMLYVKVHADVVKGFIEFCNDLTKTQYILSTSEAVEKINSAIKICEDLKRNQ